MLFDSYCHFDSVTDIDISILKKLDINTLFLDIDNTIKEYGDTKLQNGVDLWLDEMNKNGIKIVLCSNNYKRTVKPFADMLNLSYVHFCLKPSPFGYMRAKIKSKAKRKNILVCGDQIFTDIFGANLSFLKSALIKPIKLENEGATVKLRRKIFKKAYERNMQRKNPF